ncbi:MAG: hypothetical protein M1828_000912 [Chrysothrix sp. TS-e1954]|nr:MAG: hypothetical protein M1828_000912 [Chrysothrix sp. TS-e1954]
MPIFHPTTPNKPTTTTNTTTTSTTPKPTTPSKPTPHTNTRGLFTNGIWHCECVPRIPAEHFQVKKETKNKGRWFYTCQKTEDKRCGFFLWGDDAAVRMKEAVMGNSRSEPRSRTGTVREGQRLREGGGGVGGGGEVVKPVTPATRKKRRLPWQDVEKDPVTTPAAKRTRVSNDATTTPTAKRRRTSDETADATTSDEDTFDWPLNGEEERHLPAPIAPSTSGAETPRKAAKFSDVDTPRHAALNIRDGLPTPGTTPHAKKTTDGLGEAAQTPTPSRFVDALAKSPDGPRLSEDGSASLTKDVMELLGSIKVTLRAEQQKSLRTLLERHNGRYQGILRGREKTRQAVSVRESTIVKLQQQVAGLQGEVESGKTLVRHLGRKLEEENKARGK